MNNHIIPGSLQAIALSQNTSVAEAFVSCDTIIIVDVSSSMHQVDSDDPEDAESIFARYARSGPSRYDRACTELASLQQTLPGKIAVVAFSDSCEFCPAGVPIMLGGGTDMAKALRFVHVADDTGVQFILISDGEPNDPEKTLTVARSFKSAIDTIFIGAQGGHGEDFLKRLAAASGGQHMQIEQTRALAESVQKLLVAS